MEIVIDLEKKDPSYRDAFERYHARKKKIGFYFELGFPQLTNDEAGFRRLHEIHEDRVCARATDIAFIGDTIVVTIEPFGPRKSIFDYHEKDMFTIGARMVQKAGTKCIKQIVGLDIVPKTEHVDFQTEVTIA